MLWMKIDTNSALNVASGGAGQIDDVFHVVAEGKADAVCVASILHYSFVEYHQTDDDYAEEGNIEYLKRKHGFSNIHELNCSVTAIFDVACLELLCSISTSSEFPTQYYEATLGPRIHDVDQGRVASTSEIPTALKCTGEFAGHHLRIESRIFDFCNFKAWIFDIEVGLKTALQFVDDLALSANDHANTFCGKGHLGALRSALEIKSTKACSLGLGQ